MMDLKKLEVWFITGSQHLYGAAALRQVAAHSEEIAGHLGSQTQIPVTLRQKAVVTTPEEILSVVREANGAANCIGVLVWMHTFSPGKMWINGLKILQKPLLHLHTQYNRNIPWGTIDMDFMNLNQSAHGDREFGYLASRLRIERKVVTGHWKDPDTAESIGVWCRAAAGWHDWQGARFVRFGDNMRFVAVTEGDKTEAECQFGFSVNTHGIGDLVKIVDTVSDGETDQLVREYEHTYTMAQGLKKNGARRASLREAARIELGLKAFLETGHYRGFTDTFEDLHGLPQLPGIAVQRLMASGYGFAAEGDWKTAALVRAMKVMGTGLAGGNSFMEDYTYHLEKGRELVLGAHMLEICSSIADGKPSCEIHPLGIGGKGDPVRLVFSVKGGGALNAALMDMGSRFRLLVNEVTAVKPEHPLPKLPVARVLWKPKPDFKTACTAWILAGGAHHTCFSQNLSSDHLQDFASMARIEFVLIDKNTNLYQLKNELRWNESSYR